MRWLTVLTAVPLLLSGCAAFSSDGGDSGDRVTVAAAFYPLAYVAEEVAGEHADVELLTQPGGEPHDLELDVRTTATLAEADLVVFERGFQPAVDEAVDQNAQGVVLDAARVVDLVPVEESHDEHEQHAGEEDHGHAHEAHEAHEKGELDPHFWHDPLRMAELGDAVARELAAIDPGHTDDYEADAAALREELERLDASYAAGLADCERDTVVVSHDAFGYLEKYGLHLAPVAGLSPGAEPTPGDLAALQDLIRDEGITTVFSERLASDAFTEPLADDLGLRTAVLDPVEGLTDETAEEDYVSLMEANLEALREANGCR